MQYWILYSAGVGGDGFANLLEHANNVFPADGDRIWRFHHYPADFYEPGKPLRFYGCHWCLGEQPFRTPFIIDAPVLNPIYEQLIKDQKNTVITAHTDCYLDQIDFFKFKDLVQTNQIKINLYSENYDRVYKDFVAKREPGTPREQFITRLKQHNLTTLTNPLIDVHIDIERAWRDWEYLNQHLNKLGIDLDKAYYDEYLTFIKNL
jgi:hypothetical protein